MKKDKKWDLGAQTPTNSDFALSSLIDAISDVLS